MLLNGPITLKLGDTLVTDALLSADRARWHRTVIMPGLGIHKELEDLVVLRALLFESTPLILTATEPTQLSVELVRFPYAIQMARGGTVYSVHQGFSCFALRLVAITGGITRVQLDRDSGIAVNRMIFDTESGLVDAEFGNGTLAFALYYNVTREALSALKPPSGYQPIFTLNDEDSPD